MCFQRFYAGVERRVLARCDLLVISSPGFMKHYFKPMQKYAGNCFLVENKLYFEGDVVKRAGGIVDKLSRKKAIKACLGWYS